MKKLTRKLLNFSRDLKCRVKVEELEVLFDAIL